MRATGVAVVGAGWMAGQHLKELARRDDVEIRGVCDVDRARAEAAAAPHGARAFDHWAGMLDAVQPDAVWVCTPPATHVEVALGALDRGLPVYLEKPIARHVPDGEAIVAGAARAGVVCAVGYQWHASDLLAPLLATLDGRRIGFVLGKNIGGTLSRPWFVDQAVGGGNVLERASHHIDLVRALAGEVAAVQASASAVSLGGRPPATGDIEDALTVVLHLESGATATVLVVWLRDELPTAYGLEVAADGAYLHLDLDPAFTLHGVAGGHEVRVQSTSPPLRSSIDRFLAAVRADDPASVPCTPSDALRTLAVARAVEAALVAGTTVAVGGR
ncbi:MAG: Gfo/Idh/MocA family oxidoreductase [Actinomycetota bacterium]|nr:Gfo/Idh/MocA family oxidoreductase [Actinomycetota bacterium]